MAQVTNKTTYTSAIKVAVGTNPIPLPYVITSGMITSSGGTTLNDTSKNFITLGVSVGDVIYNTTAGTSNVITTVAATALGTAAGTYTLNDTYTIYQASNFARGGVGQGAVLWNGSSTTATMTVTLLDGTSLSNISLGVNQILPIQVLAITSLSGAFNVYAMW
jgi:hypothetical protein